MRIYVHGNCQGPALAKLLKEAHPKWDIVSYECFGDKIIDELHRYYHYIETADIVISQPISVKYRDRDDLSLGWLRDHVRRPTEIITYPSLHFEGQLVSCRSTVIPGNRMQYHDVTLLHLALSNAPLDVTIETLDSDTLYSSHFIDNELRLAIAELQRREESHDLDLRSSDYISQHIHHRHLFYVINHPCRALLVDIANQCLERIGSRKRIENHGAEYIPFPHMPLPASYITYLRDCGINPKFFYADLETFKFNEGSFSKIEYWVETYKYLHSFPTEQLKLAASQPHVASFLKRLSQSNPDIFGIEVWDNN